MFSYFGKKKKMSANLSEDAFNIFRQQFPVGARNISLAEFRALPQTEVTQILDCCLVGMEHMEGRAQGYHFHQMPTGIIATINMNILPF